MFWIILTAAVIAGAIILYAICTAAFYVKATADEAIIRTGKGGQRVSIGGGLMRIPIVHEARRISLKTLRLEVRRANQEALITKDNMRVDLSAQFYVKVGSTEENVQSAARSLGERSVDPDIVRSLVEAKLDGALRSVAATMDLVDLHQKRKDFTDEVQEALKDDLRENGLSLETVSIVSLDQTNIEVFDEQNVFDAQGLRRIVETTEAQRREKNAIQRQTEVEIQQKDVETEKQRLELDRDREFAAAEQQREIATNKAEREAETQKFQIEQERMVEIARLEQQRAIQERKEAEERAMREAEISRQRAIEIAEVERQQTVQVAQEEQQRAVSEAQIEREETVKNREIQRDKGVQIAQEDQQRTVQEAQIEREETVQSREIQRDTTIIERNREMEEARIAKELAVEVAERERQIAIIEKLKLEEQAKAEQLEAAAERERAEQNVLTVTATSEAEREREVVVLQQKAESEKDQIEKQIAADAVAYETTTKADAEAEAAEKRAQAMERMAQALLKEGEAKAQAEKMMIEANMPINPNLLIKEAAIALIEKLPTIVAGAMKPIENIEGIRVLHIVNGGDSSAGGAASGVTKAITSALQASPALPLADELLKFSGVNASVGDLVKGVLGSVPGADELSQILSKRAAQPPAEEEEAASEPEQPPAQEEGAVSAEATESDEA